MSAMKTTSRERKLTIFAEAFIELIVENYSMVSAVDPAFNNEMIHITTLGKLTNAWTDAELKQVKLVFGEDWFEPFYLEVVYSGLKSALQGDKA